MSSHWTGGNGNARSAVTNSSPVTTSGPVMTTFLHVSGDAHDSGNQIPDRT